MNLKKCFFPSFDIHYPIVSENRIRVIFYYGRYDDKSQTVYSLCLISFFFVCYFNSWTFTVTIPFLGQSSNI